MISLARKSANRLLLWYIRHRDRRQRRKLGLENHDLLPELWNAQVSSKGHLIIGGCDTVSLAQEYGTPLIVVDKQRLKKNYIEFVASFRRYYANIEVFYSYKTNPLPGVLLTLHELGAGAEVVSEYELWLALKLGVPPDRVIFNGPVKTETALALAISRGIQLINIDNISEITVIDRLARNAERIQPIGVRVITSLGWSAQFGLGIRNGEAWKAFKEASQRKHVDPCGLHVHLGTGIRDATIYEQAVREVIDFANRLQDALGVTIRFFDFGGGFGVPTVRPFSGIDYHLIANGHAPTVIDITAAPSLESYGFAISETYRRHRHSNAIQSPVFILEPGRAITSSAQSLLLRVVSVKPAGNYCTVILDGGRNVAMPPGFEYHEVFAASKMRAQHQVLCRLYGPLCHPGDVLCVQKRMPRLDPGDVIAVMDTGAYFIPNQTNFSNPRPAAVMVDHNSVRLIRSRETFEDMVRMDARAAGTNGILP